MYQIEHYITGLPPPPEISAALQFASQFNRALSLNVTIQLADCLYAIGPPPIENIQEYSPFLLKEIYQSNRTLLKPSQGSINHNNTKVYNNQTNVQNFGSLQVVEPRSQILHPIEVTSVNLSKDMINTVLSESRKLNKQPLKIFQNKYLVENQVSTTSRHRPISDISSIYTDRPVTVSDYSAGKSREVSAEQRRRNLKVFLENRAEDRKKSRQNSVSPSTSRSNLSILNTTGQQRRKNNIFQIAIRRPAATRNALH